MRAEGGSRAVAPDWPPLDPPTDDAQPPKSTRPNSSAVHRVLEDAKHNERAAKLRLAWLQRQLNEARKIKAGSRIRQAKLDHAQITRQSIENAKIEKGATKNSRKRRKDNSKHQCNIDHLSLLLNQRLTHLYPPPSTPSWFKVFKQADETGDGQISIRNFFDIIRVQMRLGPKQLPSHEVLSAWRSLDADGSGFITRSEFGQFMRRGESKAPSGMKVSCAPRAERSTSIASQETSASDISSRSAPEESKKQIENKDQGMNRVLRVASDHQLDDLALLMHNRIEKLYPDSENGGWLRLYKESDERGLGTLSLVIFSQIIRSSLGITRSRISELVLMRIWRALDPQSRGYITRGEFGALVRRGALISCSEREVYPGKSSGWIANRASQAEATVRAVRAERVHEIRRAQREAERHTRDLDKRAYRLAVELAALCSGTDWARPNSPSASENIPKYPNPVPPRDAPIRVRPASARRRTKGPHSFDSWKLEASCEENCPHTSPHIAHTSLRALQCKELR